MSSMYVFTLKCGSPIFMFHWLYKTFVGGRSYSSTTDNLLDFYTNYTKQHLQTSTYCHVLSFDKTSIVAYNLGENQICNLLFSFTFQSRRLWRNPRKRVTRGGKIWSPETLLYQIDTSVLLENTPLVKFIRNYIRDSRGVFSTSSPEKMSMISLYCT